MANLMTSDRHCQMDNSIDSHTFYTCGSMIKRHYSKGYCIYISITLDSNLEKESVIKMKMIREKEPLMSIGVYGRYMK